MGRTMVIVLYVVVMAATIVGVDVLFFKDHVWERLAANVGLVLLFGAFYFRFSSGSWTGRTPSRRRAGSPALLTGGNVPARPLCVN